MKPKKKKKILIISIILILLLIIGTVSYLYYTTDMFKSNDMLFYKYLGNSFKIAEDFEKLEISSKINQLLENNKYTSNIEGAIKYTRSR